MKPFVNFMIGFMFCCLTISCSLHKSTINELTLGSKRLVAQLKNDTILIILDKKDFINKFNREFFPDDTLIDDLVIKADYTFGDRKIKYYNLELSSSKKNLHVARWLFNYKGKLYIDKGKITEIYTHEDTYVKCEGPDTCRPRLFIENSEFKWSCREIAACSVIEEPENNACYISKIGID